MWWWLEFFHRGKVCGKLGGAPLFGWRQHPRQHTRTHGRLSLEALRALKAHYLLRPGGPLAGAGRLVVVSVGATLAGWAAALRTHPACDAARGAAVELAEVCWKPSKQGGPAALPPAARLAAAGMKRKLGEDAAPSAGSAEGARRGGGGARTVRLWAFGSDLVRRRIREQVADWDPATDVFVA
jgi:hypothetical protein